MIPFAEHVGFEADTGEVGAPAGGRTARLPGAPAKGRADRRQPAWWSVGAPRLGSRTAARSVARRRGTTTWSNINLPSAAAAASSIAATAGFPRPARTGTALARAGPHSPLAFRVRRSPSSTRSRSRRSPGGTRSAMHASIRRSAATTASAQSRSTRRRGRQDGSRATAGLDESADQSSFV